MLNLDPVVQVNVSIGSAVISVSAYGVGLILAPASETLTTTVRAVAVTSLSEVVSQGYAATTDTYKAVEKYFAVTPAPKSLVLAAIGEGESVAAALAAARDVTPDWYGVYMVGATAQNILDIDDYLNSIGFGMVFGTITGTVASLVNNNTVVTLAGRETRRACLLYSATELEAAALLGEVAGCAGEYTGDTWQLCYKTVTGIATATVSQAEVELILASNLNVNVIRAYTHTMLERGATISGLRVDEVIAIDRIANDIQETLLSLIAGNVSKMPQNDTTTTRFISAVTEVLENYKSIGYVMEGYWLGAAIGNVATGDYLERGYALWADSFDNQTAEDRKARKGMPIYCALNLCGSVESVVLNVVVQE